MRTTSLKLAAFLIASVLALSAIAGAAETEQDETPQPDPRALALAAAADAFAAEATANPPAGVTKGEAAFIVGSFYNMGAGLDPDQDKAYEYLILALDEGMAEAAVSLGAMHLPGNPMASAIVPDPEKALEYYKLAADAGIVDAMRVLGLLYLDGQQGVWEDRDEGLKYLRMAAERGDEYALFRLEPFILEAAEREKGQPGSAKGFPVSRDGVANRELVEENRARVKRLADKTAILFAERENRILAAAGRSPDIAESRRRQERLLNNLIDDEAMKLVEEQTDGKTKAEYAFSVGAMYMLGLMGGVDLDRAEKYLLIASDNGLPEAWHALGRVYGGGDTSSYVLKENLAKALAFYTRAADAGVPEAIVAMILIYSGNMEGVRPDSEKARRYILEGAKIGNENALAWLAELLEGLDEAEKAEQGLPDSIEAVIDEDRMAASETRMREINLFMARTERDLEPRVVGRMREDGID